MVKFSPFSIRAGAIACCSVSVLLTACGGAVDANSAAGKAAKTAGVMVQNSAAQPGVDAAPATLAEANPTGATPADATQAAGASSPVFDILGYDSDPLAAEAAADEAQAPATDGTAAPTRLLATLVPASTTATYRYYVAPTGSDSNPGTQSAPFRTIGRAAQVAKPSTTVFVAPGTYSGGFQSTVSGTASARIQYVSTTFGAARIVPPANSTNNTAWDNRGSYVDIVGFNIDGTTSQSGTKWTYGIYSGGSYVLIRKNRVHHIAKSVPCTSDGGSAIGVDSYYGGVKSEVVSNLVYDIGPAGCTFVQGIYISTSGSVKNNIVYRVSEAAIHLWHDATNVIITNNTVASSNTGIIIGGGDFYHTTAGNDYSAVYNNIVYDNKYGISEQGKTGTHNTYRNNLVYQNTYNWTLQNGLSHSGTVSSAPLFAGYTRSGTPNLHLSSSSPAIGRGTSTYALSIDFDGKPRNWSTGYDIGAYQH